ncbi:putative Dehydrogenase/reductase SDR family member 4 [Cardiosporidium cionae]|uniref:Dehydrogenase/reductase SDR family member 4 n=1 Tax=Cardiosporidium cionae TaxID=476202 RepID=A0ABQ7JEU4_9APIC|nr:putative Dehydrogenase/reductase SDR family member 4 [Cardiosporidium cionae]|eukprot:KAF8822532.1 putative Dehydrogenase/reductase SDR family member 4 [Cardiosporidium cionae]
MGTTLDIPEEQVTKILDVNVKASLLLVQEFQDFIKPNGSVLFISSYIGYKPQYPLGMYAISKTALFSLTKALAQDMWDKAQVRVNCIAPGVIKTRFSKIIWADPDAFNETKRQILMGRAGETAEISGPAAFLCSDDASYITGEVLVVGGGVSSRL